MARASTEAAGEGRAITEALRGAARDRGHQLGDEVRRRTGRRASQAALLTAVRAVLDEEGYETRQDPAGLTLANCPFRALSAEQTALVCGMNLAIVEGLLERLGGLRYAAVCDPAEGRCCVRLVPGGRR